MNQEFLLNTESFGTILREAPANDFKKSAEQQEEGANEFKQIEVIDESNQDLTIEDSPARGKNQRAESMSDKLNSSKIQQQNYGGSQQADHRQRNKALHESFGVDISGGPGRDHKSGQGGGQKPTNFGNDSLIESKFQMDSELANERSCISTKNNQLQSQIQKTAVAANIVAGQSAADNNAKEAKNSFSDLSMAATNANNNGLTAVGQGLAPDNLVGSFGSILPAAQQKNNDQNQAAKGQQQSRKNSNDAPKNDAVVQNPAAAERTAEKPKNKHHAKPRNKSSNKSQNKTKSIGHYRIGKTIGEGTFGKVKLGVHNITGEKVAVKILEKHKIIEDVDVERVSREIKILKLARHPNIIQLYEIIETPKQLYLITEYVPKGELFDYIVKKQRLEEAEACKFFQQIISGIQYLKELGIVHRDMKPENLLLDQNGQIKLVDFGLSNTYEQGQTLKTACGSPCYAAPEMIAGKEYHGAQVDVWSCGVILFAMVCGYLPFEDPDTNKLYKKILDGKFEIPNWVSESCTDLMNKILENDPEKRLDTDAIMVHDWYTKNNQPVIKNTGLIIGKNKIPLESSIVKMLKQYGFNLADAEKSLNQNKHNEVTTVYYLLHKRYVIDGKLPSNFGINRLNSPNPADQSKNNGAANKNQMKSPEDMGYSPVKKIHLDAVNNDFSQKSLARSPRSPNLAFKKSESKDATRIDSQKEIELSVSPVKKGRRQIDGSIAQQPVFELKASALNFDEDVRSPVGGGPFPNDYKSFDIDQMERERRTEEKGSRSPEKKKRRAIVQPLSSDDEAPPNPQFQVGQGLKIQLQNLSGGSNDQQQMSPNASKNLEQTHNTFKSNPAGEADNTDSSISYQGDGEKIILITNQGVSTKNDQPNARKANDSVGIISPSNMRSPVGQLDRSQQQAQRINLQFDKTSKQNTDEPPPMSTGVREYQQKIKAYTKDNYKYRQKAEGRSIDEKLKTKALLRNIEKILNQGVLQGYTNKKGSSNRVGGDATESRQKVQKYDSGVNSKQGNRQLPPQVPKTTTAAAYESSNKHKVINVKRQNRRASSIDECVVQLQIQNQNHYQTRISERPKQPLQNSNNYPNNGINDYDQMQQMGQQQMQQYSSGFAHNQAQDAGAKVQTFMGNQNENCFGQDPSQQPINFYGTTGSNPAQHQQLNHQQMGPMTQGAQNQHQRPPLHNQGLQSEKKFQRYSQENQFRGIGGNFTDDQQYRHQMVNPQQRVFSESPNRDRFNPQIGNFMQIPQQQLTAGSFKENHYQFPQGNPALYQQQMGGGMPQRGYNQHSNFDTSPKMNYVEKLNSSQEGASNTSISDQAQFRTAPQRARQTFKRQYHDGSRQHNSGTNTAQGYRTRIMNRMKNQKDDQQDPKSQTVEQSFTEQTPYKQRPSHRRPSQQRNVQSGQNEFKHANTVKPYMQRRITLSEQQQQQQQPVNDDYQTGQFQGMNRDPINFTNQYNIYCHLNDFQKYQWRGYNPVMGGPLSSPPMSTPSVGPNPQNIGSNLSSPGPQPFMQTGDMSNPLLNQYLNFMNPPENLMEYQYQNNFLKLQSQISMIQQQQLSQQLAAIGIMPGLGLQSNPMLANSNPNLMQISPAAAQLRNINSQMQAQTLFNGMANHSLQTAAQFQTQDSSNFSQFQHQISQSLSPPKKYRQGVQQMGAGLQQPPSAGIRNPSPYDSSVNQSHIAQANTSYDNGADSGLNQSSGTNFTRNIGSRRSNTNTMGRPDDSIDSKQGGGGAGGPIDYQQQQQIPDQAMMSFHAKIGNGPGQLGQPVVSAQGPGTAAAVGGDSDNMNIVSNVVEQSHQQQQKEQQ